MDEKVIVDQVARHHKIGPRTRKEWNNYIATAVSREECERRQGEFEEAVREEEGEQYEAERAAFHLAAASTRDANQRAAEAETRPCPTCGGTSREPRDIDGVVIYHKDRDTCPELSCKDGRVPRDYAVAMEVIEHVRFDAPGCTIEGKNREWARAKHGAAGEEATDDRR